MMEEDKFSIRHPSPVSRKFKQFRPNFGFRIGHLDESSLIIQSEDDSNSKKLFRKPSFECTVFFLIFLLIAAVAGFFYFDIPYIFEALHKQDPNVTVSFLGVVVISVLSLMILATLAVLTISRGGSSQLRICKRNQLRVADVLAASERAMP